MKNYAKVILYGYPLLRTVGKDYEEHIRNKALLSYDNPMTAERLAEYIAGEILCMRRLEWLKAKVEEALGKLDETDRALVEIRYFGRAGQLRAFLSQDGRTGWSERKYFRRQAKLGEKVCDLLDKAGVTEALYLREFAALDIFEKIHRRVEAGKDRKIAADERRWLKG